MGRVEVREVDPLGVVGKQAQVIEPCKNPDRGQMCLEPLRVNAGDRNLTRRDAERTRRVLEVPAGHRQQQ